MTRGDFELREIGELDLLDPVVRYRLSRVSTSLLSAAWRVAPKKAIGYYAALLFAFIIWVAPQGQKADGNRNVPLWIALTASLVATGVTYSASQQLADHQQALDDSRYSQEHLRTIQLDLDTSEREEQSYVLKTQQRLALNAGLPAPHRHPYLKASEKAEQGSQRVNDPKSKAAFIQEMQLGDHPDAQSFLEADAQSDTETTSGKYRFFTQKIRGVKKTMHRFRRPQKLLRLTRCRCRRSACSRKYERTDYCAKWSW